ncbi:MAG: DNA-processing protein DprA, partial [Pseudonocardiaceae bacterium]
MPPWDDQERATLVALVQELPQAASWPGVVAEIIEAGSARAVWDAHHDQQLFDTEPPAPIAEAARQIAGWRAAGLDVHTFRDVSYPAQLR